MKSRRSGFNSRPRKLAAETAEIEKKLLND